MTPAELRARRLALGLTSREAADLIGIGERQWQYLEAGRTSQGDARPLVPLLYELAWCELERRQRDGKWLA